MKIVRGFIHQLTFLLGRDFFLQNDLGQNNSLRHGGTNYLVHNYFVEYPVVEPSGGGLPLSFVTDAHQPPFFIVRGFIHQLIFLFGREE
jgi:hypothetical protein